MKNHILLSDIVVIFPPPNAFLVIIVIISNQYFSLFRRWKFSLTLKITKKWFNNISQCCDFLSGIPCLMLFLLRPRPILLPVCPLMHFFTMKMSWWRHPVGECIKRDQNWNSHRRTFNANGADLKLGLFECLSVQYQTRLHSTWNEPFSFNISSYPLNLPNQVDTKKPFKFRHFAQNQ